MKIQIFSPPKSIILLILFCSFAWACTPKLNQSSSNLKLQDMKAEVICNQMSILGEGTAWDVKRKEICWVDIVGGKIHQFSPKKQQLKSYDIHEMVGCFAFCEDGNIVLGSKNGFAFLDRATGKITRKDNPEAHLPENRFNDGKCDPAGRFWAGTMSLNFTPQAGSLYVFDNKSVVKKVEKVSISNGLAWSADKKTMYYIDTPTLQVVAYDYDIHTGNISNKRVVVQIPKNEGYPDGMTIDAEGMLWVAQWGGWQVSRWNPKTGEKLGKVTLPVANVSCCTFGGENLTDLYISTAKDGLSITQQEQQPLAGALFVVKNCGVKGVVAARFKK